MSFNVDVLATDDVGMVLDVSLEVHVDTTAVGVVELAIAGEGTFHKSREHDNNLYAHAGTRAMFLAVFHH